MIGTDEEVEREYLITLLEGDYEKFNKSIDEYKNGHSINFIKNKYGIDIRNYVDIINIKRSNSESKKTKQYKKRYKKTMMDKYGVTNPSKLESVKQKKKKTMTENYGYENNFCNPSIRIKAQRNIDYDMVVKSTKESLQNKYGEDVKNVSQIPGVGERISKTKKEQYSKLTIQEKREMTEYCRSHVSYVSNLELRIQEILNNLNIEYTANGFLYSYNWDLIFKNKIILEIQGDFWHGNPKIYNEDDILLDGLLVKDVWDKDKNKRLKVENYGYSVYYLWESDINKMTDDEIIEYIKSILI